MDDAAIGALEIVMLYEKLYQAAVGSRERALEGEASSAAS